MFLDNQQDICLVVLMVKVKNLWVFNKVLTWLVQHQIWQVADVAAKGGLDRAAAHAWLASDVERDVVEGGDREARNAGISGVPFFIFNRAVGVSGAQDPQTLLDAMMQSLRGAAAA